MGEGEGDVAVTDISSIPVAYLSARANPPQNSAAPGAPVCSQMLCIPQIFPGNQSGPSLAVEVLARRACSLSLQIGSRRWKGELIMKMRLSLAAMTMALALSVTGAASPAKNKVKWSAAHREAVAKCNEDYNAARKEARTKRGKERKEAEASARQARKQCLADAPK